jgi:hypothetical protein
MNPIPNKREERAAFIGAFRELRSKGLSSPEARTELLKDWVPHRISRASAFRWFPEAEQAFDDFMALKPFGDTQGPGEPPPPAPAILQPGGGALRVSHLPIGELVAEAIGTFQSCMRFAVGADPSKPRNPNLALKAAGGLTQAIATSLDLHAKFHDAARMEEFTAAVMAELEHADPAMAQRVLARLDALTQAE